MPLYDISRTLSPVTAAWPGDRPFSYEPVLKKTDGHAINLTQFTMSPHIGTHADAGFHFDDQGTQPYELPLAHYIGRAQVVTIEREEGAILPDDVADFIEAPLERLLIHTWVSDVPDSVFPEDFPYPSVALIDWLAEQGAVLLGMDSPSVDDFNSKTLDGHHRLASHGMVHLENLMLAGVPDGLYELVALPLKFKGLCASPVRAVLRG